jgi:hypothetical protein
MASRASRSMRRRRRRRRRRAAIAAIAAAAAVTAVVYRDHSVLLAALDVAWLSSWRTLASCTTPTAA